MEFPVRKEVLFEGLNADERRRLFFLFFMTDQLEVREALQWAVRIEAFIRGKTSSQLDPLDPSSCFAATTLSKLCGPEVVCSETVVQSSGNGLAGTEKIPGEMANEEATHVSTAVSSFGTTSSRPKLDRSSQIEFFKAIARGATNGELAARFGLTKRQAHALRIAIMRRTRSASSAAAPPESRQCATEGSSLKQMEADVVRFLRQIGDVVVKKGDEFVVNSILKLNFPELIARANAKRQQRGKSNFELSQQSGQKLATFASGDVKGEDGG